MTKSEGGPGSHAGHVLVLAALGVVFGDIGTSPLYALQTIFEGGAIRPVAINQDAIYGVVSVIFWSITMIVTILYIRLLTRADNDGEGGLLSLLALLKRQDLSARRLKVLLTIGVFGAALFFGDSMITPAISVLSSVEGLEIVDPGLHDLVVPGAVAILVALLAVQRWGTAKVGRLFGPIMSVWFVAIALCGLNEIVREPAILQALSPLWAIRYFVDNPLTAFLSLGGVVLVVTGAEALYADMAHVGRTSIVLAWLALVFPALTVNYFGQGALLLRSPDRRAQPVLPPRAALGSRPDGGSGDCRDGHRVAGGDLGGLLGHQPGDAARVPAAPARSSTSAKERGQIYLPFVNAVLFVAVISLVIGFHSSARLAAAYGLADIGTIATSTALFFVLQFVLGDWPRRRVVTLGLFFMGIVLAFLGANLVKIAEGGWLPVSIGVVLFVIMTTWHRGRLLSHAQREKLEGDLQEFVDHLHDKDIPVQRVPGCAVFLSRGEGKVPLAMRAMVEHTHCLHESAILLTIESSTSPEVPPGDRVYVLADLGYSDDGNVSHVVARLGYRDSPSIPTLLHEAVDQELEASREDIDSASFFLSVPRLQVTNAGGMKRWRKHLYRTTARLTSDPVEFFDLPRDRTIVVGAELDI